MFRLLTAICLCILLIPAQVGAESKAVIELQAEAWVEGKTVVLSDIAVLVGEPDFTAMLGEVSVGTAPLPGASRRLTPGQIEVRLRQAGINPREVEFTGAPEVVIHRGEAVQPSTTTAEGFPVVVASRDILRLQVIASDDLEIRYETRPGAAWNSGQVEDFVGKRATRHFSSGSVLTLSGVEVPPVVDRGSPVLLISEIGGVRATAPGVARAAGSVGEIIPVENTISKQIVYGEIIDSETVRVMVGGQ